MHVLENAKVAVSDDGTSLFIHMDDEDHVTIVADEDDGIHLTPKLREAWRQVNE